jgi:hypothetical protein
VEGGTRVELDATCAAAGGFWKLVLPLARFLMECSDRKQLDALAALVEATTGGPGTQVQGKGRTSQEDADHAGNQGRR